MSREWNIAEQARIARENFEARPEWVKSISYFAGTNNVCPICGRNCGDVAECVRYDVKLPVEGNPS